MRTYIMKQIHEYLIQKKNHLEIKEYKNYIKNIYTAKFLYIQIHGNGDTWPSNTNCLQKPWKNFWLF